VHTIEHHAPARWWALRAQSLLATRFASPAPETPVREAFVAAYRSASEEEEIRAFLQFAASHGARIIYMTAISTPCLHIKETIAVPKPAQAGQATVTIKQIAATIAEQHEIAKKQSEAILNDMVGLVTKHLKKGDRIRISGLGILQVRKRAARMGRNPATGEAIKIKASKKIAFRAAKELKEAL
jgi:DNA-binding protein HU-beta